MERTLLALVFAAALLSTAYAHEHHPPHQGVLIVLGKEFAHLELVLDKTTGTVSAYSLDGEVENAEPLKQAQIVLKITPKNGGAAFDLALKAVENPLTGETVGNTSEFKGQSDALKDLDKFAGVITAISTKGADFKDVAFDFPEGNDHD